MRSLTFSSVLLARPGRRPRPQPTAVAPAWSPFPPSPAHDEGQLARKPRDHGGVLVTEDDFKGGVHAAMGGLVAIMCAYNLMRWCATHSTRHAVNFALYAPLWAFEGYQTWLHWRTIQ